MLKFLWLVIAGTSIALNTTAQDSTNVPTKTDWSKVKLTNRANDHFMIQFGYDTWMGAPDSFNIKGLSRHFNAYAMYDIPFKTDPRLSVAIGVGVGSSGIFFEKTDIDIAGKGGSTAIAISNAANRNHFKKTKVSNTWLEAPLELRYVANPLQSGKSFKIALGFKLGTLIDVHTKGKNWENAEGTSLYGNKYVMKERSKRYFNSTRMAGTLRVGYGAFTLYGAYQLNRLFKEGQGPNVHPLSIGLCLGGL